MTVPSDIVEIEHSHAYGVDKGITDGLPNLDVNHCCLKCFLFLIKLMRTYKLTVILHVCNYQLKKNHVYD